ncbi:MAG: hypothetical protein JSR49_14620, partial [Proteobacteria bacterium]|nr:hypothetical protein [Pseudomonadota bacterium]
LIDALRRSGSAVIVLLTKADRLGERDRWEVYGHVTARLQTGVDPQVPVFFASSTSSDTTPRDDWIARGLQPFVARRETLKSVSLHHKVQRIRADIIRCLEQLSGRLSAGVLNQRIASVQREGINLVADAERRAVDPQAESRIQIDRLLREVAHNAAELSWQGDEAAMQLAAMIEASLTARADAARRDIVRKLELLAAQCGDLLAKIDGPAFAWQAQAMPLPTLDVGALVPVLEVPRPWFAGFGAWVVQWYLLRKLRRRRLPATLETLLRNHLSSLDRWRHAALSDLGHAFAGACEARLDEAAQVASDLAHLRAALRSPTDRGSDDAEEGRDAHTRLHGG